MNLRDIKLFLVLEWLWVVHSLKINVSLKENFVGIQYVHLYFAPVSLLYQMLRWLISVAFRVQLKLKKYFVQTHLFLKEITYMFWLKCGRHEADYKNKKHKFTAAGFEVSNPH
jgi:hypothetical protein